MGPIWRVVRPFFDKPWSELKAELRSNLVGMVVSLIAVVVLGVVIASRLVADGADQHSPVRWHNAHDPVAPEEHNVPSLAVYSVPNVKPPHALPTLRDLGGEAQVRAIEAMQKAAGTEKHPWDDLRKAMDDSEEPGETDPYLFERVLVATVGRGREWMPGDRMVQTEIKVTPVNFKFAAYTIAATDNESVKVSSVEATDARKVPSDLGLTFPKLGEIKINGLPGKESIVKATSELDSQFEQLGIDIEPDSLHILRESGLGGDVVGNTRIALSMTTDALKISDNLSITTSALKVASGDKQTADKPQRDEIVLAVTGLNLDNSPPSMDVVPLVPLPHCALKATVSATYIQRHIVNGRQFYDEAMHDVEFVRDTYPEKETIIAGADDVSPFVWSIQLVPPGERPDNGWHNGDWHALSAWTDKNGTTRQIVFSDYGRAVKMAHWVRTHAAESLASTPTRSPPEDAGRYTFNYREAKYSGGDNRYGLVVIKQTGDACKEQPSGPAAEDGAEEQDRASHSLDAINRLNMPKAYEIDRMRVPQSAPR